jgi:protein-disulfide isomerase
LPSKKYAILIAISIAVAAAVAGISLSAASNPDNKVFTVEDATSNSDNEKVNVQSRESLLALFSGGSPLLGSRDAPVSMVEFGDYQCTNCARYFRNTEPSILQNYVETGKLNIIFVDFPFIGPDSKPAAQAAHCANDQGKYWEYHDETYSHWNGENTGWASIPNLKKFASNIDLDQKSFDECLDSKKYAQKVENNFNLGNQLGVTGTPTFFIIDSAGRATKIVGAQPYSTFVEVLDSKL